MNIFDRSRSLLKKKSPTAAELAEGVAAAREAYETAKVKAGRERLLHPKHLLAGAFEATKHKQLLAELDSDVQDATVFLAALEERHAEVAAAEAEAARLARYDEAAKLAAEVGEELATKYPELAAGLVQLLHRVTYSDDAISAANEDRPAGRERLRRVEEMVRDGPDLPRKNIRERVVALWAFERSQQPLSEDQQAKVIAHGDRHTGFLPHGSGAFAGGSPVAKRRFRRIEYVERVDGLRGARLADMAIPSLRARDPDFWTPGEFYNPKLADTQRRLNVIQSGERVWRPEDRKVKVEYVPTEEPGDAETD